jgi:hypothetical protein
MTSAMSSAPPAVAPPRGLTLDRLAIGMFFLLSIEFILGMILGLFVSLPSGSGVVAILSSTPVLDLHILLAVFIIGISARAIALARAQPERPRLYASVLALVSALVATAAGWGYAFEGQAPGASFVMSLGFLGVMVGAFVLYRRPSDAATRAAGAP